jgi:hypothetical protein
MAVRSCRVTIEGTDGVAHTVEVTAATLYEAVAQGIAALRGRDWVDALPEGHNLIKVAVAEVPVVHQVKAIEFAKWLERAGGSPRDVIQRHKVRAILGMPVDR